MLKLSSRGRSHIMARSLARSFLPLCLACCYADGLLLRAPVARISGARVNGVRMCDQKESSDVLARDRPGNYVSAYTSALGVSVAATMCSELVPLPGSIDAAVPIVGRMAACMSVPLLCGSFAALRFAARAGPPLLRTRVFERLNLGLALSSVAAGVITQLGLQHGVAATVRSAFGDAGSIYAVKASSDATCTHTPRWKREADRVPEWF